MRTRILMVFLLFVALPYRLCDALDFCGDPLKTTEKNLEKSIDEELIVWQNKTINFEICRCPLCRFMKLSQGMPIISPPEKSEEVPVTSYEVQDAPREIQKSVCNDSQDMTPVASDSVTTLPDPAASEYKRISNTTDCRIVLYVMDGCSPCRRMKQELTENFKGALTVRYPLGGGLSLTGAKIEVYPTAEIFYKDKKLGSVVGYVSWQRLEQALDNRVR